MAEKELLQELAKEGKQAIATMNSCDDPNFMKWEEKTKTSIRRIYKEDSPEYKEIMAVNGTSRALAPFSTDAEILDRAKKDAQRKIAKLEAWAELEEE